MRMHWLWLMWCSVSRTLALFPWLHCAKSGRVAQGCMRWSAIYRGVLRASEKHLTAPAARLEWSFAASQVYASNRATCYLGFVFLWGLGRAAFSAGAFLWGRAWWNLLLCECLALAQQADEAVIDYLAKHATRERHYSQWHHSQGSSDANLQEHWRSLRASSVYSYASKRLCSCKT